MGRAARRKAERRRGAPVLIAGDGMIARTVEQVFNASTAARNELPPKHPGQHRWIATAAYILRDLDVAHAYDEDTEKYLDHENLFSLAVGCWDCEQPLGAITADSRCTAPGDD